MAKPIAAIFQGVVRFAWDSLRLLLGVLAVVVTAVVSAVGAVSRCSFCCLSWPSSGVSTERS